MGEMPSRPPSRATVAEAADVLRRLVEAVDRGELGTTDPKEVALIRRLQGVLAGWQSVLGESPTGPDHEE